MSTSAGSKKAVGSTISRSARPKPQSEILSDAERVFVRYGFRRASMSEVAREAGISRAGLYKRFASKEALFREVVTWLHETTLEAVDAAARNAEMGIEDRLVRVFDARVGFFIDRHHGSPHAGDLLTESNRICGDVVAESARRFRLRLARLLRDADAAGELDLASAGLRDRSAADLAAAAVVGIKGSPSEGRSHAEFRRDLSRWVAIFVRGLQSRA